MLISPQNVYGMAVDLKTAEFTPWTALIDQFVFNKDEPYFNIMVPTADTTRYFHLSPGEQAAAYRLRPL